MSSVCYDLLVVTFYFYILYILTAESLFVQIEMAKAGGSKWVQTRGTVSCRHNTKRKKAPNHRRQASLTDHEAQTSQ